MIICCLQSRERCEKSACATKTTMPNTSIPGMSLEEARHYGPVTALKFLSNGAVFAGNGPFLRFFSASENTLSEVWRQRVFKRNKIHSIALSDDERQMVLAGGRSFCVVSLGPDGTPENAEIVEKGINEWIVHAVFGPGKAGREVLVLSSHNQVLRVEMGGEHVTARVQDTLDCGEKSILYSGTIQPCPDGRVLVAAGTVMSGVILWDMRAGAILRTFCDHEGSIFQAKIDPSGRYLVTCSDDRSIKLYNLHTGALLGTAWGHGLRIWSLSFARVSEEAIHVFSTGEDCLARLWLYAGNGEDAGAFGQAAVFPHCHEGKHIWSGDAFSAERFVTGGADGKVRVVVADEAAGLITLAQNSAFTPRAQEHLKQFAVLGLGGYFLATSLGTCFFYSGLGWQHVDLGLHAERFGSAIVRSFPDANMVKLFARDGGVLSLQFSATSKTPVHIHEDREDAAGDAVGAKVINVLTARTPHGAVALLVDANQKLPFLLKTFVFGTAHSASAVLPRPDPKNFTPTALHHDPQTNTLYVGSRHGNLAVYNLAQKNRLPRVFWKLLPGDTITSVSHVHSEPHCFIGLFTVRDGVYLVIRFAGNDAPVVLVENKFPRGSLEGGYFQEAQVFLYGFRSSAFFLCNETWGVELALAQCAGAHREWHFTRGVGFSWLSKSGVGTRKLGPDSGLLAAGTHGREIRSVSVRPAGQRLLIATASEDASVKFGTVEHGHVTYTHTMRNHVSGLQKVAFLDAAHAVSSAANEELVLWRLSAEIPGFLAVTEALRLPVQDANPDLRIMDFSCVPHASGFLLAAIYSNSQIRVFDYSGSFTLVAEKTYSTCCLLNVELVQEENTTYMFVGATDGVVTVYEVGRTVEKLALRKVHQSGVKALWVQKSRDFQIITGGDDNSLCLSTFCAAAKSLDCTRSVEQAAAATITGIASFGGHVIVTSVDQVVRLWSTALEPLGEGYTTVADTGCVAAAETGDKWYAFVAGAGLSVFSEIKN